MTDNNLVSFKVYFENEDGSESKCEVRRFGIESDVASSYTYLSEKLKTVFPCLRNASNIHIYWKDTENDNVRICSDAELIIALTEIEQPIKKLFIKMMPSENNGVPEQAQQNFAAMGDGNDWNGNNLHLNVVCDGCDGSVTGFRYKCLQCQDYDLCSTCEAKSFHPEHFMLRMPVPIAVDAWINDGRKGCHYQKWQHVASAAMGGGHHSKKHFKKHHHNKHHNPMKLVGSIGEILSQVVTNVGGYVPQQQANTTQESRSSAFTSTNENKNPNNVTKTSASFVGPSGAAEHPSNSSTNKGNGNDANGNNIIESLVQNFDDVLTGVLSAVNEIQTGNSTENQPTDGQTSNSNDRRNSDNVPDVNSALNNVVSVINELLKAQKLCETNKPASTTSTTSTTSSTTTFATSINNGNSNSKGNTKESDSDVNKEAKPNATGAAFSIYPTAPKDDEILTPDELKKVLLGSDGIRVKPVVDEPVLQQKEAENGWTLLTEEKNDKPKVAVNSTGAIPKTNVNNNKNDMNNDTAEAASNATNENGDGDKGTTSPPPDKVAECLRRMLAMGFSNEGNWLGDLIAHHNGDINAVIEQLLPVRK